MSMHRCPHCGELIDVGQDGIAPYVSYDAQRRRHYEAARLRLLNAKNLHRLDIKCLPQISSRALRGIRYAGAWNLGTLARQAADTLLHQDGFGYTCLAQVTFGIETILNQKGNADFPLNNLGQPIG